MRIIFLSTLISFFFLSNAAHAVREVGNGGNALLCSQPDGRITAHFFDYEEVKWLSPNLNLDLGPNNLNTLEKVDYVLTRLAKVSPRRAALYRQTIQKILKVSPFIDTDLATINDSMNVILPENCRLKQLAVQINPDFDPYNRQVLINKKLYNRLDSTSQAGLLLHEAIYREAIANGAENSSGVRYFNAQISSAEITSLTLEQFAQVLNRAGLVQFDYQNFDIVRSGITEFHENGLLKKARTNDVDLILKSGTHLRGSGCIVTFDDSGNLTSIRFANNPFKVASGNITLDTAEFDSNGVLIGGIPNSAYYVLDQNLSLVLIHSQMYARFDFYGYLIR